MPVKLLNQLRGAIANEYRSRFGPAELFIVSKIQLQVEV
jgi:hypothetical protein